MVPLAVLIAIGTTERNTTMFIKNPAVDTKKFYELIDSHEWLEAAELLLQYTETNEDPQDWISCGDWGDRPDIEAVAAEFDAYCECE